MKPRHGIVARSRWRQDSPTPQQSRCAARARSGRVVEAPDHLLESIRLGLGDLEQARQHLPEALRLEPHHEQARRNLDALARHPR